MDKILVTLVVPSVEEEFDVLIPDFLPMKEVACLLAEAVSDVMEKRYAASGYELLCRKEPYMVLHPEYTLAEYGVEHGEYLYLF